MSRNKSARERMNSRIGNTPPPAAAAPQVDEQTNPYGVVTTHRTQIDGQAYTCHMFGGDLALQHLTWLTQVAAGPAGVLTALFSRLFGPTGDTSVEAQDVGGALLDMAAIIEQGGPAKMRELLANTEVRRPNGTSAIVGEDYNVWAQGRPLHVVKVIKWVLKVNFGPFLGGGQLDFIGRLQEILNPSKSELKQPPSA
jgi:hypothetical protein